MAKTAKKGIKKKGLKELVVKKKRGRKPKGEGMTLASVANPQKTFGQNDDNPKFSSFNDEYFFNNFIGKYVVCRGYYIGVHAGILVGYDPNRFHMMLKDARRLWRWESDFTLSAVAIKGMIEGAKVDVLTPQILLRGVDEIIPCTEKAEESIREYPVYVVPEDER